MFPGAEQAVVEEAKIRDYLLSTSHPVGRFKAVVFFALGYAPERWETLRDDLLAIAKSGETRPGEISPWGQKFEVSGTLRGPHGREARFITVWLVPVEGGQPRFITAFPG